MIILGHLESEDKQKRFCFYSVTQWRPTFCDPTDCSRAGFSVLHHLPELAQTLVHWVGDAIQPSSPVIPFSCPQSFPASRPLLKNWLFTSGGQNIGASASASIVQMNIQNWFPLELTSLISLKSKGLYNTTVQKQQFFSVQTSLWSSSNIHTWLLGKQQLWPYGPLSVMLA